jgi:phosphate transport system protein
LAELLRREFHDELDQLRLQVELMGVRVDHNLERMREVLLSGDERLAAVALAADDDIDAMNVSLTERCYVLLARESPVAVDLRFVVSVLRIISELERIGDLALRVVKLAPEQPLLVASGPPFDILVTTADGALDTFRRALRAWAEQDLELATGLLTRDAASELYAERLVTEILQLEGRDAVRTSMAALVVARSLERIADHARIIGARLRYLITGEAAHLAAEVR